MAIVQISRIQHRKGLLQDLPQLASAEVAWALDEQRLFIGNGSLAEGAPFLGNTEILTEHSDLIGSASAYAFKGNSIERTVSTSLDGVTVFRGLQDRLDDYVSVRAFDVDGVDEECSAKINHGLKQLFGRGSDKQTRIGLYIPAGVYLVTSPIKIPPRAYIFGDGKGKTVIYSATPGQAVFKIVDSAGNSGVSMGSDLIPADEEVLPQEVYVQGITFEHRGNNDLSEILSTADITFFNCEFKGSYTNPTTTSTQTAFSFESEVAAKSKRARLMHCTFTQLGYALDQAEELPGGVVFNQCNFLNMYHGIQTSDGGSGHSDPIIVQNCVFDGIARQALEAYDGAKIFSMGNHYVNCGNAGTGVEVTAVITFGSDGCVSWADHFERDADGTRVETTADVTRYAYMDAGDKFSWGHRDQLATGKEVLADGSTGSLSTVSFDVTENRQAEIMYTITRSDEVQSGLLRVAVISGKTSLSDDFTYTGTGDAGVIFSLTETSGVVTINWTTTSTGDQAEITISPVAIRQA